MATPKASGSKKRSAAAKKGGSRSAKAGLIFPVGRVGSLLRRQTGFGAHFRSSNVAELDGREFSTVVCAAAPAQTP